MLDQSPHQLAPRRAQAGAGRRAQAARRRRGAAVRDRPLRPLRLGRLDRVLARARARDRRGLPRAQARRGRRCVVGPGAARATAPARGSPSCGCCSRPRRSTATGSSARASRTSSSTAVAPDWYRDPRSPLRGRGERAQAGARARRRSRSPGAVEDVRAPMGWRRRLVFAGRFVLGSLAGAVFVPVGSRSLCAAARRRDEPAARSPLAAPAGRSARCGASRARTRSSARRSASSRST